MCHTVYLLKIFESFENHPFQIKQQNLTTVASKNEEIATHVNNYFNDITKGLNIKTFFISDKLSDDQLVNAIWEYENHPSVIKIKSSVETTQLFDFNFASSERFSKTINSMVSTKKTSGAIPIKIVKLANKQICKDLADCINECIKLKTSFQTS